MNTVQIDFCATLDLSQGSAAITIKITDLYAQAGAAAPEFAFDYDVDSTTTATSARQARAEYMARLAEIQDREESEAGYTVEDWKEHQSRSRDDADRRNRL